MSHTNVTMGRIFCALLAGLAATGNAQESADSIPVTVTEVRSEAVAPAIPAAGTVFSRNEGQVTAGIAARIQWIAEPGDFVPAGQPVARFDCTLMELQKEELVALAQREEVNLAILTREAERQGRLVATMTVSATQLDRTRADRDLAASALAIARVRVRQTDNQLARCIATAPFSGVLTQRLHRAGEDVERSAVLAQMTDTRNLEIRASLPIRHLPRVGTGEVADIRFSGLSLKGQVRKIVPAADPLSQTFQIRVDLPESAQDLLAAGQLVSITLPLIANAALTVPRDSVVLREEGAYVMRISGKNLAERVFVEVADAQGDRVAIRGSLTVGDRVAVRGAEALNDGQPVSIQADS